MGDAVRCGLSRLSLTHRMALQQKNCLCSTTLAWRKLLYETLRHARYSPRPVAWLASVGGVVPPGCDSDMHTICRNAIRCTAILMPSPLVWISDELVYLGAARCQCLYTHNGPSFRPTTPPCTIALAA